MRFRKNTNRKEELPSQPYTKGTLCIQIGMTLVAILFIAPIFIILNYSFKGKKELYLSSPLSLPESFNLDNYIAAFKKLDLATTFTNTFIYTAVSVVILAILCGTTAWAIARCSHRFFKFCYIYFIIGILIPYQALFLPIYTIGYKLFDKHEIRNYLYVCGHWCIIWRFPDEQFYVHCAVGAGRGCKDRRVFGFQDIHIRGTSDSETRYGYADHYAVVSDLE